MSTTLTFTKIEIPSKVSLSYHLICSVHNWIGQIEIEEIGTDCLGLIMMQGGTWEATDSIYISKSETLLNPMTFRMTPNEKPHKLKGKPFCVTLAYPSV